MNIEQIQNLQQRLAYALNEADKAKAAAISAENAYDVEFDKVVAEFETAHPDLTQKRAEAQQSMAKAQERAKALRDETQRVLGNYFLQPNAESKPADGFSMRQEKEAFYDAKTLLLEAVEQKATCFLMLDEKAIQKFVVANAEKDGNLYQMPDYLRRWMPGLQVATVQKPLISDKELIKVAPEFEPLELKSDDVSDLPF